MPFEFNTLWQGESVWLGEQNSPNMVRDIWCGNLRLIFVVETLALSFKTRWGIWESFLTYSEISLKQSRLAPNQFRHSLMFYSRKAVNPVPITVPPESSSQMPYTYRCLLVPTLTASSIRLGTLKQKRRHHVFLRGVAKWSIMLDYRFGCALFKWFEQEWLQNEGDGQMKKGKSWAKRFNRWSIRRCSRMRIAKWIHKIYSKFWHNSRPKDARYL